MQKYEMVISIIGVQIQRNWMNGSMCTDKADSMVPVAFFYFLLFIFLYRNCDIGLLKCIIKLRILKC